MIKMMKVLDFYDFLEHAVSTLKLDRGDVEDVLMVLCDERIPNGEYVSVSLYDYLHEGKSTDAKRVIAEMKEVAGFEDDILVYAP